MWPYKEKTEGFWHRSEGGSVNSEAEIRVMRPQAKEHLEAMEAGRSRNEFSL